jgi:sugar lactone lactonase YvrE
VLSNRRTFVTLPEGSFPDGMAVDSVGQLWIAVFNGWRIERYALTAARWAIYHFLAPTSPSSCSAAATCARCS